MFIVRLKGFNVWPVSDDIIRSRPSEWNYRFARSVTTVGNICGPNYWRVRLNCANTSSVSRALANIGAPVRFRSETVRKTIPHAVIDHRRCSTNRSRSNFSGTPKQLLRANMFVVTACPKRATADRRQVVRLDLVYSIIINPRYTHRPECWSTSDSGWLKKKHGHTTSPNGTMSRRDTSNLNGKNSTYQKNGWEVSGKSTATPFTTSAALRE